MDRYLHYSSYHHPKVKSGIADCLHHRAERICQQGSALADERMHVQMVLMANGYPKQALVKKRRKRQDGCWSGWPRARVFLPYIKGISEKIRRVCKPMDVQMVFTSRNTLRKSLMKVKGRPGMMDMKGIVYSIPCAKCSATYVGETGRTLRVCMAEHRRAVKNKDPKNGVAMHVQKTVHTINWQEAKILGREDNWGRRRVLEALVIQQRRPMVNLDAGLIFMGRRRGQPLSRSHNLSLDRRLDLTVSCAIRNQRIDLEFRLGQRIASTRWSQDCHMIYVNQPYPSWRCYN